VAVRTPLLFASGRREKMVVSSYNEIYDVAVRKEVMLVVGKCEKSYELHGTITDARTCAIVEDL
jgi:hypothetical protein